MTRKAGMSWISLLDLLFGVFGSLIVLAALISFKRGSEAPSSDQSALLVTVTLTYQGEREVAQVLGEETYLAFLVSLGPSSQDPEFFELSAALPDVPSGAPASLRFTSASDFGGTDQAVLSVTLMLEGGLAAVTVPDPSLRVVPVLQNSLRLEEVLAPTEAGRTYSVALTVIDGTSICDHALSALELVRLVGPHEGSTGGGRQERLNFGSAVLGQVQHDCGSVSIEGGELVFKG